MDVTSHRLVDAARAVILASGDELYQRIANLREQLKTLDQERQDRRRRSIRHLAVNRLGCDGAIEFDDDCAVSESSANGAYVEAWVWVDFDGTSLDTSADSAMAIWHPDCGAQTDQDIVAGLWTGVTWPLRESKPYHRTTPLFYGSLRIGSGV
ncbi:MAG: hypothetical protein GXY25_18005 [Pirellulaceae bacterium]|jgi:hypothetical protein|nr:hypothetical protein [Thermoguttaceae bacterium]MDI9443941.1 hypothetical protein [Planctomycetota bacterium]NLZ02415.1 hypothetical protein [Pirellulaceae bacterium]